MVIASQYTDNELLSYINSNTISLRLEHTKMPTINTKVYCDNSNGVARPYSTIDFRRKVFNNLHGLSHPSIRATVNLVRKRFVWRNINKDCIKWSRSCIPCQKSKIHRHTVRPLDNFDYPAPNFTYSYRSGRTTPNVVRL